MSNKEHWENIYTTKQPNEVSWTQEKPHTSLELIAKCNVAKNAKIIDIGGGDSLLVDFLLKVGYTDISVLDISSNALKRAQKRLGDKADLVTWIVADIATWQPTQQYSIWHDRAVFHFLAQPQDILHYTTTVAQHAKNIILGTFSTAGPLKCSALHITQYDKEKIEAAFCPPFHLSTCFTIKHTTPFDTEQDFIFAILTHKN